MKNSLKFLISHIIVILSLPLFIIGQDVKIGLEVDSSHSVLMGAPLNGQGNRMVWHPQKSALLVGDPFDPLSWSIDSLGDHSTAFGIGNIPAGDQSMTWGFRNWIEQGNENTNITIFGFRNKAYRNAGYSFIGGLENEVKGYRSLVFGSGNIINEGSENTSTFGSQNVINADDSHVWGKRNTVNASLTTTSGTENELNGLGSIALGAGLITRGSFGTVVGIYNDATLQFDGNQTSLPTSETPLFVVGNGKNTEAGIARSNALSVFANGFVKIGSDTAVVDLHIKQSESSHLLETGGIRLENSFNNNYWQIYSSGDQLSFGRAGERRAFIDSDGTYVDLSTMLIANGDQEPYTKSNKPIDLSVLKLYQRTTDKGVKKLTLDGETLIKYLPEAVRYSHSKDEPLIDKDQLLLIMLTKIVEQQEVITKQGLDINRNRKMIEKISQSLN